MDTIQKPKLSVVIPAYNVAPFIEASINSVLQQERTHCEIIVVDDGSTDETLARIRSIDDLRISVLSQENKGLSAARNAGIRAARGQYLAFLDGDDTWLQGYASKHINVLDSSSEVGISFSYLAYINEQGSPTGQLLTTRISNPTKEHLVIRNVITSHAVVRRQCLDQVGGFDEDLKACEDQEMWIRVLSKTQYKAKLTPLVLSTYRIRQGSLTTSFEAQILNANLLLHKLRQNTPAITKKQQNRALAEAYRIASRKALALKLFTDSERYFRACIKICPTLILSDLRAFSLGIILTTQKLLPEKWKGSAYDAAMWLSRQAFRTLIRLLQSNLSNR